MPKIMCKCENYMAWIQEQKMPLHLHVDRDKKIMFDQVWSDLAGNKVDQGLMVS